MAIRQLFSLETRMRNDPALKEQYINFMSEYEKLNHMQEITETTESGYYTPHHAVHSANKFRTVFNASAKTSTGITLNETQLTGEKMQRDLFFILLNFRKYKYAIHEDDR